VRQEDLSDVQELLRAVERDSAEADQQV
jgi:hypothetical protein